MEVFQREMERTREEREDRRKGMEKNDIKWEWANNYGHRWNGNYEGEVKDNKPHGLGRWKEYGQDHAVEGEWKDGQLNGRAIYNGHGYRNEYEAKDGKINGKYIRYYDDGDRI